MRLTSLEEREAFSDSISKMLERSAQSGSTGIGGFAIEQIERWYSMAEMGLIGVRFDEDVGGLGLGAHDFAVVMKIIGQHLVVEPYLASATLGGGVARKGGASALSADEMRAVISGSTRLAFAYAEPRSRYNPAWVETTASQTVGGLVLNGTKSSVLGGADADIFFVSARTSGNSDSRDGISLFRIPQGAQGISHTSFTTIDGRAAVEVTLKNVKVMDNQLVGPADKALPLIEQILDEAAVGACAEIVGAMEELNRLTLEYCKMREAFGQPLSKMQAIQHRLVDMYVAAEYSSAMLDAAADAIDADDVSSNTAARAAAVSAAMVTIVRDGNFVARNAVQLHGAIGTTEELSIGRYFKRILANSVLFGDVDYHSIRYRKMRQSRKIMEAL